jgi:flavin-dependent dehydrogenase
MEPFDIVIIGAGLAGLQCARLLGRQGLRVLLVDRKTSLDQKIHTTGIFVRRTLDDFDIPEDCLGSTIRRVSLYSPTHRVLHLESEHAEYRIGKMARLYQHYLNQCHDAHVEWLPGATYVDSHKASQGSLVRFRVGTATHSIKTRLLIAGDGACSRVAGDLQLDLNREWIVGVEDVYEGVKMSGGPRLLCFLDPQLAPGYIAWIAYDGEEAHVGVGGYPNRFDPTAALNKFHQRIHDIVDLQTSIRIERRGGRIPVGGILKRIANTRGLLIGDAAGAVSPLTAGGLDPCMRLSTLAANVVSAYLSNGDETVLRRYSGELFRAKFTSRLWARRMASSVTSPALAEVVCGVLRLPGLSRLAARVFFGNGSFPDVGPDLMRLRLIEAKNGM